MIFGGDLPDLVNECNVVLDLADSTPVHALRSSGVVHPSKQYIHSVVAVGPHAVF